MPVLLFVCTANQFRSPLAAACFARKLKLTRVPGEWKVLSAGTWASEGLPAHPRVVEAAEAMGLDLKTHRTREVSGEMLQSADLIVVMQTGHKEALEAEFPDTRGRIVLLGSLAGIPDGDIADPAEDHFSKPEIAARIINSSIEKAFLKLVEFSIRQENERKRAEK